MYDYPFTKYKPVREEVKLWQTEAEYKPTAINYFLNTSTLSHLHLAENWRFNPSNKLPRQPKLFILILLSIWFIPWESC